MAQLNEWLTIDKLSGEGNATITLTASSSQELNERVASLRINGKGTVSLLNVKQLAFTPLFSISPNPIHLTSDGSEIDVTITGNTSWELIADDWVTISDKYGSAYGETVSKTIKISAAVNTGDFRQGVLKVKSFSSDVVYASVAITQDAFNVEDYVQMVYVTKSDNETLYLFNKNAKNGYLTKNVGSTSSAIWRNSDNVKVIIIDGVVYDVASYSFSSPLRDGFIIPNAGEHNVYVKFTDNIIRPTNPSSGSSSPAFRSNEKLKSVVIPSHYQIAQNGYHYGLFFECSSLQSVNMNGVLDYITDSSTDKGQDVSSTFYGCTSLETVLNFRLQDGVIRKRLCNGRTNLKTFTVYNEETPNKVEEYAFYNCKNLHNDFIVNYVHNKGVSSIGKYAFYNCLLFEGENGILKLDGATLANNSFANCTKLKTVYAEEGFDAFANCGETLYLTGSNPWGIENSTFKKVVCMQLLNQYSTNWLSSPYLEEIEFMSEEQQDMRYEMSSGTDWNGKFNEIPNLKKIIFHSMLPPIVNHNTLADVPYNGTLIYPKGADYSQILSTEPYYLGYYGWTGSPTL